jgi:hypothetical protein
VGASLYSRDLLMALPGFRATLQSANKRAKLTLWGNLPGMSESPVLESAVMLHDSSHYDLDFTLLRGRVVLTNIRTKGPTKVWLRTETGGVALTLPQPDDQVALEIYGRWAPGVPFSLKKGADHAPVRVWEVNVLNGRVDIKADRNEWAMSAPPGRAYFHGDSVAGPASEGPQPRKTLPEWADPKAKKSALAQMIAAVVKEYTPLFKDREDQEVLVELFAAADKDKDPRRAAMVRELVIYAYGALDRVDKVAELLGHSTDEQVRKTAVIALRHWIGVRAGRDEKLFAVLVERLHYTRPEAETVMQLLHSPFAHDQAETYETLITYLRHRKQAVRELAHWHLMRLAPIGRKILFDAAGPVAEREKAVKEWKALIPSGELPKEPDDTKDKKKPG